MEGKKWYMSRTLWVNAIAGIAGILQAVTGTTLMDPEAQVGILALVNLVLRLVTKTGLSG